MIVVGVLLTAGLALVAVESVGYVRGGFNSEFWALSLDDKLARVGEQQWAWWWVASWSLVGLFLMSAGVVGLTQMLAEAGEPTLAAVALGGFLVALMAWVAAQLIQAAAVSRAARVRVETGETPGWMRPLWDAAYLAEAIWVFGTNLAYAVFGLALVQTALIAPWAGWTVSAVSLAIVASVAILREGFPQLGILAPAFIGVMLLIT